jgi:hypothetical protein
MEGSRPIRGSGLPRQARSAAPMLSMLTHSRWLEYRNDSEQRIPAFGVVRITGLIVLEAGRVVLTADQPDTYGCQYQCAINGPLPINAGKLGTLTREPLVPALVDTGDGVPAFGQAWGPRAGTWKLRKNTGGFVIAGSTNASAGLALVEPAPLLSFVGKTDGPHVKGTTGTISIYVGTLGSESDTTINMTGVYNRFADVDAGKWVRCAWNADSNGWELVAAEC